MDLEKRTQEIMRERKCTWHEARAIMGRNGAAARRRRHGHTPVTPDADFEAWKARMEKIGRF